jgi:hypothetical protein
VGFSQGFRRTIQGYGVSTMDCVASLDLLATLDRVVATCSSQQTTLVFAPQVAHTTFDRLMKMYYLSLK